MAIVLDTAAARPIDVFISYSSADVAHAELLQTALTARGVKVYRDKAGARPDANATGLTPGQHVDFALPAALREAKAVVVLWSASSVASAWVAREAHYAAVEGKLATLHIAPFEPKLVPAIFAPFHSEPLTDTLANPDNLLKRLAELSDPVVRSRLRRIDISRLPTTYATRLFGREAEMADLNKAWDSANAGEIAGKTNVLVLDAMGGTGKTALVNHFVQGLAAQGWRGAEAVFVWSFYSQGTDEKRQASADDFFKTALAWFGHTGEAPASQHDKGVRLAELIAAKRALVILDGLEPLQYGPARRAGGTGDAGVTGNLKDQGLRALLRQLATSNPGLVVVTTRLRVPDLAGRPAPAVITERLGPIPTMAGVELVRTIGVKGRYEELKALVEDLSGHAIALTQVATWLVNFRDGDVRCRDELPSLVDLGGDNERDPFRVMLAYETQFKRQVTEQLERGQKLADIAAAKQLALLFLMGLFDRPMEKGDREALLAKPAIPGLTEGLVGLTPGRIDYAVQSLRDLGLLLPKDEGAPGDLDAHPLVREYFGARLEKEQPKAWRAAHGRLYDYYKFRGLPEAFRNSEAYGVLAYKAAYPQGDLAERVDGVLTGRRTSENSPNLPPSFFFADKDRLRSAAKLVDGPGWNEAIVAFLPETEEAMAPLFNAIAHGCASGRHDEAFIEVHNPRINRGNEAFATAKLGLFGSELAALAHFFAEPFAVPEPRLSPARQALLLSLAGFALRALGRTAEAVEPMRADVRMAVEQGDWTGAAAGASNLSELLVTLGRLRDDAVRGEDGAVTTASQSAIYADRSGDAFHRSSKRSAHADALLQSGAWVEAVKHFTEAEAIQRESQPSLPLLYSVRGYQLCDLKLAQGRAGEMEARARQTLAWAQAAYEQSGGGGSLLDIALGHLSLGRGAQLAAASPRTVGRGLFESAGAHLDTAVEGLRASGSTDDLPRGLLARAAYHRDAGNDKLASKDLTEAFEIAERGGMRLFLADCWLESARQRLARPDPTEAALTAAAKAIDRAAAIVAETGYHRRDPDLALVRAELALAKVDAAGARPQLDALIAAMRTNDLWSFLPELARLAERHTLADLAPTLADLSAQRARFDEAADAAFEEARRIRRADGLDDDIIDARLADPEFRVRLNAVLVANGYKPLDETPIEEQRNDARQYILEVERRQDSDAKQQEAGIDPDAIPDELVDGMLGDADFRKMLDEALVASDNPKLADLDGNHQRAYARAMIAAMAQARNQKGTTDERGPDSVESAAAEDGAKRQDSGTDPDSIPDELVDEMLRQSDFRRMLDEMLARSGIPKLAGLDGDRQRAYARAMIAALAQAEDQRLAGDEPAPEPTEPTSEPQPQRPPPPAAQPPQDSAERNGGVLGRLFGPFMRRKS